MLGCITTRRKIFPLTIYLSTFQASLALSEWCISNKDLLQDKSVLELGSGVGLVGLTIARTCQPRSVTLTDCHPAVLATLCQNLTQNLPQVTDVNLQNTVKDSDRTFRDSNIADSAVNASDDTGGVCLFSSVLEGREVNVLDLPWEEVGERPSGSPDVVLGADIVYDSAIFEPLSKALVYFLSRNLESYAVLACTERNKDTLGGFLQVLGTVDAGGCVRVYVKFYSFFFSVDSRKLVVKEIESAPQKYFFWNRDIPIRFFKISSA